jgi:hypothetical protein
MTSASVQSSRIVAVGRPRGPAALAAIALALAVCLAEPAPATAIETSTLTLTPSSTVITWGDTVVLSMAFGTAGANRIVVLETSRDTITWENINILTTDANGNTSWPYRPATNRYYRATFQGAADLAFARSPVARVVVRQVVVLKPSSSGGTTIVSAGRQVPFALSVRPSRPELLRTSFTFAVYRRVGSTWQRFTTRDVPVDPYGNASYTWTFSTRGEWYVRASANPTPDNANSMWSRIERYSVR